MSEKIEFEIISPDETIIKAEADQVILPAFEGLMTILKNHISLVTFLRPGIIVATIDNKNKNFYVEDGTVEFSENNLLILSSTAKDVNNIKTEEAQKMIANAKQAILKNDIKDKDKYILSYKIDTLQEITQ
ncbi:MAG: ATP synthase F1 subunit epsilon [Pelagibacteraceae bacterium]